MQFKVYLRPTVVHMALLITPLRSYLAHLQFTEAQQAVININSYIAHGEPI